MNKKYFFYIKNKNKFLNFGKLLSKIIFIEKIFLFGNLGIGKTTLVKNIIKEITNNKINIKSPTYNIIKSYIFKEKNFNHVDFYKIEKNNLNIKDFILFNKTLFFAEWADKIKFIKPDLSIFIFDYYNFYDRKLILKSNKINFKKLLFLCLKI